MEFGFVYCVTLRDRTNPPGRHRESSDLIRDWFESNAVQYGMGALGGSRVIYGTIHGCSEQELAPLRSQFAEWLSRLSLCAAVSLGRTQPAESINLMEEDWELSFDIDNLTDQDRAAANAYHTDLLERVQARAKKPANEG